MMAPEYDTIIIGGGVAGLACALLRARRGDRVAIAERSGHLFPTLRGFFRQGAYMDSGFHYASSLGQGELLHGLLQELGLVDQLTGAMVAPATVDRVRFLKPALDFCFPQGWERLEQELCRVFPTDGRGLRSFLAEVRSLWEQSRTTFGRERGRDPGAFFAGTGGGLQPALDRCTGNPVLQGLLAGHGILYGAGARETSLLFHSQVVGSFYESTCLIQGGGRIWVDAFETALAEAQVQVLCGRAVSRICLNEEGGFVAVELATGERLSAQRCIHTAHPKWMLDLVPTQAFSPAYRKRVGRLEETFSAVVLYGRCRSAGWAGNLILAPEPQALGDWAHLPVEERPLFVSASVGTDSVSVICPAHRADVPGQGAGGRCARPPGYQDWKMRLTDRFTRRLSQDAPDVLDGFEPLDMATPLTFCDRLNSPQGALYGVKHRLADLPLLPRTAVPGLYLSGQAVVAPGVLGALCAGFLTESCII
jgi:all-trans-retinol 13,14-reductase